MDFNTLVKVIQEGQSQSLGVMMGMKQALDKVVVNQEEMEADKKQEEITNEGDKLRESADRGVAQSSNFTLTKISESLEDVVEGIGDGLTLLQKIAECSCEGKKGQGGAFDPGAILDMVNKIKIPVGKQIGGIVERQKFNWGGVAQVPGSTQGDSFAYDAEPGSFILNRNASRFLGYQMGGTIPTLLEPGELIFPPGTWGPDIAALNKTISRFQSGGAVFPLPGGSVGTGAGQKFGAPRPGGRTHDGIDIVEFNTPDARAPVVAMRPGTITEGYFSHDGYAGGLQVKQDDGQFARYVHVTNRSGIKPGDEVQKGEELGKLISLGTNGSNSHLHLEMATSGGASGLYDPTSYVNSAGKITGPIKSGTKEEHPDGKEGTEGNEQAKSKSSKAVLAYGSNDAGLGAKAIEAHATDLISRIIQKGYDLCVVPPNPALVPMGQSTPNKAPHDAVTAAASNKNVDILPGEYNKINTLHLSPQGVKSIKASTNGAKMIGDDNAMLLGGKQFAKTGAGYSIIQSLLSALESAGKTKASNAQQVQASPTTTSSTSNSGVTVGKAAAVGGGNTSLASTGKGINFLNPFGGAINMLGGLLEKFGDNELVQSMMDRYFGGSLTEFTKALTPPAQAAMTKPPTLVEQPQSSPTTDTNPSSSPSNPNSTISAAEKKALDIIGKYESDSSGGYEAVNQGAKGGDYGFFGHSGKFGDMSQHKGKVLSTMSIGDIKKLHSRRHDPSYPTEQWIRDGKVHATGRYQFIGDTFEAVTKEMGIKDNEIFNHNLQDRMALHLLRTAPNGLEQWVGPANHATAEEKAHIEKVRRMKAQMGGVIKKPKMMTGGLPEEAVKHMKAKTPRLKFQTGGVVGMQGSESFNQRRFNLSNDMNNQRQIEPQVIPLHVPTTPQGAPNVDTHGSGGGGASPVPNLPSAPTNHIVSSLMMQTHAMMQRVG